MTKIYIPVRGSSKRRGYIRRTKLDFKQIAKRTYEITSSISDANTIINGSPKEKVEAMAGQIIPYYGLVKTGTKLIRTIL